MKHSLMLFIGVLAQASFAPSAWSATYSYDAPTYNELENHGAAKFTKAMKIAGTFETAVPLPANLSDEGIDSRGSNLIQTWRFTDGLNTYTPENSTIGMLVSTNASSEVTDFTIVIQSPKGPYAVGQRTNDLAIVAGNPSADAVVGSICSDTACRHSSPDASTSTANAPLGKISRARQPAASKKK